MNQDQPLVDTRYCFTYEGEDGFKKHRFDTMKGWPLLKPQVLYNSIVTTPLLAERLDIVAADAIEELDRVQRGLKAETAMLAIVGKQAILNAGHLSRLRLVQSEFEMLNQVYDWSGNITRMFRKIHGGSK